MAAPDVSGRHRWPLLRRADHRGLRSSLSALLLLLGPSASLGAACSDDSEGLKLYARDFSPAVDVADCAAAGSHSFCDDPNHGPLVRVYCPVTCMSCQQAPPADSGRALECADRDSGLGQAYSNCSAALPHCDHPAFGDFVRENCPVSCGVCGAARLNWTVVNISYDRLTGTPSILHGFVAATNARLLGWLPGGVAPENVRLSLAPGDEFGYSAAVEAEIGIPRNRTSREVEIALTRDLAALSVSLAEGIGAVVNISQVVAESGGPIWVTDLRVLSVRGPSFESAYAVDDKEAGDGNCTDHDQALAKWAALAHLDLRGCLDVLPVASGEGAALPTSIIMDSLKLSPAGYCFHMVFGPHVRKYCPATCKMCDDQVEPLQPLPSTGYPELKAAVPFYDLEVRPRTVEFYFTVDNMDFEALTNASRANYKAELEVWKTALKQAIATEADKISADQVQVELHAKMARVRCIVTPSDEEQARYVFAQFNNSRSMKQSITQRWMTSAPLAAFRTGQVKLTDLTAPVVSPPFVSSLATCSAQNWASSNLEVVEYFTVQLGGPLFGYAQCQEKCAAARVGARLLSCIKDQATYELIKEGVLKGVTSAWIGHLQPYPTDDQEPTGGWTWMNQCNGYLGFWFPGLGAEMTRQPDNGAWWAGKTGQNRAEDCAVLLNGFMNATAQGFDVPCEVSGRSSDIKDWIPDQCLCESASKASAKVPMCSNCRPPLIEEGEACKYEFFGCSGIMPGESCKMSCKLPYTPLSGKETINATCPKGNSNPFRLLQLSKPLECECPEPDVVPGYAKSTNNGAFICAVGYAGTPEVQCPCGQLPSLHGCKIKQSCAMPAVDRCRVDVSDCENPLKRYAGSACEIKCRSDNTKWATGRCPDGNTDAAHELEYNPLKCTLDECDDPPAPEGYNKTSGGWKCATGYIGVVTRECFPKETEWIYPACTAVAALSGCQILRNCDAPPMTAEQNCKIDAATACASVEPGSMCEIGCRYPFEGVKTQGICPEGNTDPGGLVLNKTLPTCTVVKAECDKVEPAILPVAYMKMLSGWSCATSYTGVAEKTCVPTVLTCALEPVLSGCSQIKPCEYTNPDCRYEYYNCLKVQPGAACSIGCKAPYTGNPTKAFCSSTNNDPNGLSLSDGLPECTVTGCGDPDPIPTGYKRTLQGWECAPNYTHSGMGVVKTCKPSESGECSSMSSLSGCVKVKPCVPLVIDNACWLNTSSCDKVQAGTTCPIRCRKGWQGTAGFATCPAGNVDPTMELLANPPECFCEDPFPIPPGYKWDKDVKKWLCATGYAGAALKRCLPGPNCTTLPVLEGCYVPVPCEVALWEDAGSSKSFLRGTLRFGPSKVGDVITEEEVISYKVFFADTDCERLGQPIAEVQKKGVTLGCCDADVYTVPINARVELGTTRLCIVAVTAQGIAPDGGIVDMEDIFGAFQDKVEFSFTIVGLDYAALKEAPMAMFELEMALKEAIAAEASNSVKPTHVTLAFSAGSVVVDVVIKPPYPIVAGEVQFKLASNPSMLSVGLRHAVSTVESLTLLGLIQNGLISITNLGRPVLVTDHGGRVGTSSVPGWARPCSGSVLLTLLVALLSTFGLSASRELRA